ncbi:Serine/threonine protein kinase [Cruoricaptor ignavus]|uniref:Serine/threonine protein kinase n=1 Tax=Cruoricaptor ignavus TaxID=1118202 RepID=A0A1M6DD42_9FLAO|nr:protein kinase family protein [Cruoricaptor ignavus]SHI70928.1 Serine/threonine protein kinase [Cruoricaptor ignavus]
MIQYPSLTEYEIEFKKRGRSALNFSGNYEFITSQNAPIKIFNHGSGAYAAIYKIRDVSSGKHYALRVFLKNGDAGNIQRVVRINEFLEGISAPWLCKSQVFTTGVSVMGRSYPAILMEWSAGKKLNDFVSGILHDNTMLENLQKKIVELSQDLESKNIAHGDIQSGNVLVEGSGINPTLKLVDYDAMFVPTITGQKATETGHSSFQHPRRTKQEFNPEIDRFSFWLILTALEVLKCDKKLWTNPNQGGFYDGDNFLFRAKDLEAPQQSRLVSRLRQLNRPSLNFYLDHLFSNNISSKREVPKLYSSAGIKSTRSQESVSEYKPKVKKTVSSGNDFVINSTPPIADVYLGDGSHLGTTPLKLDKDTYASKKITVKFNENEKSFYLNRSESEYNIFLGSSGKSASGAYFYIDSTPSGARIFAENGQFVEKTPATLPISQYANRKVKLVYDNVEERVYLNAALKDYHINLKATSPPPKPAIQEYGYYDNGQLYYVDLAGFEDRVRSGWSFKKIYKHGVGYEVNDLPELKEIVEKYKQNKPISSNNNGVIWALVILLFFLLLIFFASIREVETELKLLKLCRAILHQ